MQAAFIDIGRERSAFLHAAEILPISETEMIENENITTPDINELLHLGQTITVQVIKDEIGTKGSTPYNASDFTFTLSGNDAR